MKQIIINSEELQTRVAVVNNGILHDFFMERKSRDQMVGSIYKGVIRNLEPSLQAAFVDIGVHQDGLVHISQITNRYIKHPSEVLKVGDIVDVWVIGVDTKKNRISLTMKKP